MGVEKRQSSYEFAPKVEKATNFIARSMVEEAINLGPNKKVLIIFDNPLGKNLALNIGQICDSKKSKEVIFFLRDLEKEVTLACRKSEKPLKNYFSKLKKVNDQADIIFLIRADKNPEIFKKISLSRQEIYEKLQHETNQRRIAGLVPWCLIYWPTEYEAKKESLDYETYFDLFWEACNQPWLEIKKAQKKLIEKLDQGRILEFKINENDPNPKRRTNLKMSIEGMTFVNSTIDLNYPGSEVYSAPVLSSVEGQIFFPGEYQYEGKSIEDIFLNLKKGQIEEFSAIKGKEFLEEILNRGEGAKYLGEVAFGTNPGLKRKFFNTLLNEKVGGSIHLAIGHCYENEKDEDGRLIKVNNGNTQDKTSVHWDLSLLMHPQYGGGKVLLDGKLIQENGQFLDPALAILNPKFE